MAICTSVGVQKMAPPLPDGIPKEMARVLSSCFEADPGQRPSAHRVLKVRVRRGSGYGNYQSRDKQLESSMLGLRCCRDGGYAVGYLPIGGDLQVNQGP